MRSHNTAETTTRLPERGLLNTGPTRRSSSQIEGMSHGRQVQLRTHRPGAFINAKRASRRFVPARL